MWNVLSLSGRVVSGRGGTCLLGIGVALVLIRTSFLFLESASTQEERGYDAISRHLYLGESYFCLPTRSLPSNKPSQRLRRLSARTFPVYLATGQPDAPTMSIFSYIRSIYSLDTIDTRFTNPSSNPYKTVVDTRAETAVSHAKRDDSIPGIGVRTDRRGKPIAQPSKWRTAEFIFYYFVFLTIVPYMFWIAYDVSRRRYTKCLEERR